MNHVRHVAAIFATCVAIAVTQPAEAQSGRSDAQARLQAEIQRAIHAEGPMLLASERALIERKCGYAPGSWDGENFSMTNGILICSNGRRVDDPEVRSMMAVAGRRISRRVNAAMASPQIRAAIDAVAEEAEAEALAALAERRRVRRGR